MQAKTVIIGLGETGYSCVEYFVKKNVPIVVLDTRENPPKLADLKKYYPEVPFLGGKFSATILESAKEIVLSPGIPKTLPDIINHIQPNTSIIGDIELFAREVKAPIVAVTGSNGKSTVTTWVGEMAKQAGIKVGVGGNLGTPALKLLTQNPDLYVLELSSFQLETTYSLKPKVATILNICPDHMDRYEHFEDYFQAKKRIYHQAEKVVVNRDDELILNSAPKMVEQFSFGLNAIPGNSLGVGLKQDTIVIKKSLKSETSELLSYKELKLFGRHNAANALASLALGMAADIPLPAMVETLKTFKGLPHRCEWIREYKGVQWINDSKGTNVGATLAAISGLAHDIPGKWVLIAGGIGKNADFSPLIPLVKEHCRGLVLLGEAREELYQMFSNVLSCKRVDSLKEAVEAAAETAKEGDGVLLSPACASFDMFRNFEDRGNVFKELVLKL